MAYLTELRTQWRPLLGVTIGLACGYSTTNYVTSIMAPHLIAEFGWSKAQFALVGSLGIISIVVFPVIGRLADVLGVWRTALIGTLTAPLANMLLSQMQGDIRVYIALYVLQGILCTTTTTTVFSRAVVQHISGARGLALALAASGPAVSGALGGPLLNNFVAAYGWRAGYVALAAFSAVMGGLALLLLPSDRPENRQRGKKPPRVTADYRQIFRNSAFWTLLISMVLCNSPTTIALAQLNLVLLNKGATTEAVSALISFFAIGVLLGRFISGLALDRFPPHIVAFIGMVMPAIGLILLASSLSGFLFLAAAVMLLGLAFGAEGDVVGFLVVRLFGVAIYGTVMGLLTAAIAVSAALGAAFLSLTLKLTGHYEPFLMATGVMVALGAGMLLLLPKLRGKPAPQGDLRTI